MLVRVGQAHALSQGRDYVTPDERGRVLAEMRRVLRPGGAFVYSSHNLASLPGGVSRAPVPGDRGEHPELCRRHPNNLTNH